MEKIKKQIVLELLDLEREVQEEFKLENASEKREMVLMEAFQKGAEVLNYIDGTKGHFVSHLASGIAIANLSDECFLKCLEVCGIEVTEE